MKLLDGKACAKEILRELQQKIHAATKKPHLTCILVGENPASLAYVKNKRKRCEEVGITSSCLSLPATISQKELQTTLHRCNEDPSIDAILVQLPLPSHIDTPTILLSVTPEKDVDGFHPLHMGYLLTNNPSGFCPCTPLGIQTLLQRSHIPIAGKHVVIVGRSSLVGKPLAALLLQKGPFANATVTIAHSHSQDLPSICRQGDILIAAAGHPHLLQKEMVREGAVVVDVGIHRLSDGSWVGDVDFQNVAPRTSHITPVPGGVGPMTVAMLLHNTVLSWERR